MKNTYEFNIEDINKVTIVTVTDPCKYTVICTRKINKDGTPTETFIETYAANEDVDDDGAIGIICPKCGTWNYCENQYSYDYYKKNNFENLCKDCDDPSEHEYSENSLINMIMTFFEDKETFDEVEITINNTRII